MEEEAKYLHDSQSIPIETGDSTVMQKNSKSYLVYEKLYLIGFCQISREVFPFALLHLLRAQWFLSYFRTE